MFNFGKQNPNAPRGAADTANTAGTLIGDTTGVIGGLMGGASGAGFGGTGSFIGNTMLGLSEISQGQWAGGLGDLGAGIMGGVGMLNPAMAADMPGLGVAAGGMQAVGHGIEAARHVDEIDGGYQNNQFWTETGSATLGAASAIAALDPTGISSLYVGGTQLALDGLGSLSGWALGDDYRFTAGSAVGALEHGLFDTGQAIASGGMAAYDWATDGGPSRALDSVGSGMSSAASWAGDGLSSAGSAIASFFSDERLKQDIRPIEGALDLLLN
jgi:hypothetical protein